MIRLRLDLKFFRIATGDNGVRIARVLYGLALIPFGLAQFGYEKETASLEPPWQPGHAGWPYFTGASFLAAWMGVLTGKYARYAAALYTFQLGMFTPLERVSIWAAGTKDAFQLSKTILSFDLTAGAWVVADSSRITFPDAANAP